MTLLEAGNRLADALQSAREERFFCECPQCKRLDELIAAWREAAQQAEDDGK